MERVSRVAQDRSASCKPENCEIKYLDCGKKVPQQYILLGVKVSALFIQFPIDSAMIIHILDVYPPSRSRISKDTNGGYGTVNDYGDGGIPYMLKRMKAKRSEWPPMHCAYVAAVLRHQGHTVSFAKATVDQFDPASIVGCDLCLMTSSIVCHETEVGVVTLLKARGVQVGMIGPFATALPDAYLEAGAFVVNGEPEFFFQNYDDIAGLRTATGVLTASGGSDCDSLPFPAWDLVLKEYRPRYNLVGRNSAFLPIIGARGCPYSCSHYCVYPLQQGKKLRMRSPSNLVAEMSHWQDTLGVGFFLFRDPVFSLHRQHTVELCEEIIKSGRRFKFVVETHLKNLDPELTLQLKQAGLEMVKVGIESSSPEVMAANKRFTIVEEEQLSRIRFLEQQGVKVTCFYIFGFPNDTEATCDDTIRYAKEINSYGAQFSVFTPYPGTPVFKEYESKLITERYEDFTQFQLVYQHANLAPEQIRRLLERAYTRYYTNPAWLRKNLFAAMAA